MPGGRPPKPTEVKRRTGNPGKRSLPEPVVVLPAVDGVPDCPVELGEAGLAAWVRLWQAGSAWLSPKTDLDILVRLAQAHDERAALRARLAEDGPFTTGSTGQLVSHPAVAQLRKIEELMTRWESLCGFSPSDRSRLGLAEVKRVSKLEQMLANRASGRKA